MPSLCTGNTLDERLRVAVQSLQKMSKASSRRRAVREANEKWFGDDAGTTTPCSSTSLSSSDQEGSSDSSSISPECERLAAEDKEVDDIIDQLQSMVSPQRCRSSRRRH
eukprot:Sspe_Gene.65277::Locus_38651_Transcript_2_3_Confidence_0.400_Length_515::g.65277::m.65277